MDLSDPMVRNVIEVIVRVEVMVLRRDIDVIDVEENSTIGQFDDFT